jgi:hypothetical protein
MTLAERLGHHPENRRRELERVARILFDEFEDAQKGRLSEKRKGGGILKLVLCGSHARGDWGGDRLSDDRFGFDLLVVSTETFTDPRFWYRATDRFLRCSATTKMRRDLSQIVALQDEAEPLLHLHLCTGPGPLTHCALRLPLFALADNAATFAAVLDDGPEEANLGMS